MAVNNPTKTGNKFVCYICGKTSKIVTGLSRLIITMYHKHIAMHIIHQMAMAGQILHLATFSVCRFSEPTSCDCLDNDLVIH